MGVGKALNRWICLVKKVVLCWGKNYITVVTKEVSVLNWLDMFNKKVIVAYEKRKTPGCKVGNGDDLVVSEHRSTGLISISY